MEGIGSIDVEDRMIEVVDDPTKISREIAGDILEKLGYKLIDAWLL